MTFNLHSENTKIVLVEYNIEKIKMQQDGKLIWHILPERNFAKF